MSNIISFRYQKTFQLFKCQFLVTLLFVLCETQYLSDDEILSKLRPLKYSKQNCKEFCENIICEPIIKCSDGIALKNESYCNCCDACVKFLDIGQPCKDTVEGSLALGAQSRCKQGTICKDGKCKLNPDENSCLLHRDIREKHIGKGNYASEIWIPQCDEGGTYTAKQKKITKSVCVDKSGNKIFGSADDILENTCACSRYMLEKAQRDPLLYHVKPQEHCSSSGSFDTLQCIGNLCYCADTNTGQVESELVRLDFLDKLPCYDSKKHGKNYQKDCEIQLQRSRKLTHELWKKGVEIIGIDKVKCDPDGTFSPTQCLPDRCVCTDKEGIGIGRYAQEIKDTLNIHMTCNCARDDNSFPFMLFTCETYGSYIPFTCFGSKCVCVDEDGESISNELENSSPCGKLIKGLSKYPEEDTSSPDSDYDVTYD